MKSKYIKVVAIFVLIISILFFLWNCLLIYIAGFMRECDRIIVTDNNREIIASLMEETIAALTEENSYLPDVEYHREVPDINRAKEIEYHVLLHDVEFTVYYEDGTTDFFYISHSNAQPLKLLIQNEGYNVYFRSREFVEDLIKMIIPLMIAVFAAVLIRK